MVNERSSLLAFVRSSKAGKGGFFVAALAACLAGQPFSTANAEHLIFDKVWSDFHTGFAIGGYDVVAYHVRGEPVLGKPEYEARWLDYFFHFANEGNMKAFLANPEVYLPAFGGFSPVQMAEGRVVEGNPLIWTIDEGRLLIFSTQADRLRWRMERERLAEAANRVWLESSHR